MDKERIIQIENRLFFAKANGFYESKSWPGLWFLDWAEIARFIYNGVAPDQTGRQ